MSCRRCRRAVVGERLVETSGSTRTGHHLTDKDGTWRTPTVSRERAAVPHRDSSLPTVSTEPGQVHLVDKKSHTEQEGDSSGQSVQLGSRVVVHQLQDRLVRRQHAGQNGIHLL